MRRVALLSLVPLAALALAACGGGSVHRSSPQSVLSPTAYVRGAAERTAVVASEHVEMSGQATAAGVQVKLSGSGDFASTPREGSMHTAFSAGGVSGSVDEILKGTTAYLSSPLFSSALPSGKTWVKIDLQQLAGAKGVDLPAMLAQTPAQALDRLAAVGRVTTVGSETIDGVKTTHYRVRIDPSRLSPQAKAEALAHMKYGPFDVWVTNGDGYVRKLSMSISFSAGGQSGTLAMTMSFSKFGETVHVTPPPAGKTVDGSKLDLQGLGA